MNQSLSPLSKISRGHLGHFAGGHAAQRRLNVLEESTSGDVPSLNF
jgi:hypothetical protein